MSNDQPKCRFGFKKNDIVWTPMRRRAVLTRYNQDAERWSARYINAVDGQMAEETILDPRHLRDAS